MWVELNLELERVASENNNFQFFPRGRLGRGALRGLEKRYPNPRLGQNIFSGAPDRSSIFLRKLVDHHSQILRLFSILRPPQPPCSSLRCDKGFPKLPTRLLQHIELFRGQMYVPARARLLGGFSKINR